ncbi:hypothetical protein BD560DRAFT_493001 [Blakeslea trispora]|nr:hypothetical protein BD560DRAFT_493001 [Blakeslea trispora]
MTRHFKLLSIKEIRLLQNLKQRKITAKKFKSEISLSSEMIKEIQIKSWKNKHMLAARVRRASDTAHFCQRSGHNDNFISPQSDLHQKTDIQQEQQRQETKQLHHILSRIHPFETSTTPKRTSTAAKFSGGRRLFVQQSGVRCTKVIVKSHCKSTAGPLLLGPAITAVDWTDEMLVMSPVDHTGRPSYYFSFGGIRSNNQGKWQASIRGKSLEIDQKQAKTLAKMAVKKWNRWPEYRQKQLGI